MQKCALLGRLHVVVTRRHGARRLDSGATTRHLEGDAMIVRLDDDALMIVRLAEEITTVRLDDDALMIVCLAEEITTVRLDDDALIIVRLAGETTTVHPEDDDDKRNGR